MEMFNKFLKDSFLITYGFILLLGVFVGTLFVIRSLEQVEINTKSKKLRFVSYGVGSSMLITWIVFEVCIYFSLPPSLSAALGGGAGFLGAEVISRLALSYFRKKFVGEENEKSDSKEI